MMFLNVTPVEEAAPAALMMIMIMIMMMKPVCL